MEIVDVRSDGGNISVGGDVGVACGIGGASVGMMVAVVGVRSDDDDGNIGGVSMVAMVVVLPMDDGIVTGSGRIGNGCGGEGDLTAYENQVFCLTLIHQLDAHFCKPIRYFDIVIWDPSANT